MLFTPFSLALLAFLACNSCQKAFYEGSTKVKTCIDTSRWGQLLVPVWNRIRCAGGTLWDDICAKVSCIHVGTDVDLYIPGCTCYQFVDLLFSGSTKSI